MADITVTKISRRLSMLRVSISNLFKTAALPGGKSILTQVREILKLKFGPTGLGAQDYYWYNMSNIQIYKDVDLATFGGNSMTMGLHRRLNSPLWDAVVTDKLVMAMVFSSSGIPQPELYAAACRYRRECGDLKVFSTEQDLSEYLANGIRYPFFCKPIKGGLAKGCYRVEDYDRERRQLHLADGDRVSIASFLKSLVDPTGWGFMFQEAVLPHPETAEVCGDAVSGCRIMMLLEDDGARSFRATWKIPVNGNFIDNYVRGKTGNLLADVDIESGLVTRAVSGFGVGLQVNCKHPDTGANIVGMKVPDWENLMAMVQKASLSLSGFRFQHWDVGLTSKGPVVFELNTAGDLYISELAKGSGVYDAEMKAFVGRYGEEGRRSRFVGEAPVSLNGAR